MEPSPKTKKLRPIGVQLNKRSEELQGCCGRVVIKHQHQLKIQLLTKVAQVLTHDVVRHIYLVNRKNLIQHQFIKINNLMD